MSSSTGVWQKALVYLGLWEESVEPYDDVPPPADDVVDLESEAPVVVPDILDPECEFAEMRRIEEQSGSGTRTCLSVR